MVVANETHIKPHVAVLPSVGMGHLIPLLELAKRLVVEHGMRVSLLVITTNAPSAAQEQLLCSPDLPPDLHIVKLPPVDVDKVISSDMDNVLVLTRLCLITEEGLRSLKSVLVSLGKPRALVTDLFTTQAFDVCNELSIPAYLFSTTSVAFSAFALYLPKLDSDVECEFIDLPEPIQVPGCTPVRTEDLLDQVRNRKIDEYKWFFFHISRLPLASGVLLNSWEDLEPVSLKAITKNPFFRQIPTPLVHPVGPLIKQEETLSTSDVECLEWLDKQPPDSVLFVTLGSGGTLSLEQQTELAWGLELSQQRFIWVVRKRTDTTSAGSFFNVGNEENDPKAYLPEGFLSRTQGVGLVVRSWASQVAILRHPSTGGFLSHCGWNSSLESIAQGVPMIAWPLYAEQRMNAAMLVEDVGVAVKPKVEPGRTIVARQEVEKMVRMVMDGEEGKTIRKRVKELKESAAKALDINGSSYDSLSFVAKQWKTDDLGP
ncbi:UDP-glucuronosyl/UDP-glucosyltransferase - like 10 [Theobroma cacao]|nr:UDP-glucuronosyl/UDP-glucosyltransferase - like 10 [Theobroma cacao]